MFDQRFLLIVDDVTMRHRLLSRISNDFGKASHELAEQLRLNQVAAAEGRRAGRVLIDATQPLTTVADDITRLAIARP